MRTSTQLRWLVPLLLGIAEGCSSSGGCRLVAQEQRSAEVDLKVPLLYPIALPFGLALLLLPLFAHRPGDSRHGAMYPWCVVAVLGDVRTAHRLVVASQAGTGNLCRHTPIHRLGCGIFGDTGRPSTSGLRGSPTCPSPSHRPPIVAASPGQTSARSVTLFSP